MQQKPYTTTYTTVWPTCDNVVISLCEKWGGVPVQVGIVEVRVFKDGKHKGEAYLWNLFVNPECRGRGYARILMQAAYDRAQESGCHTCVLEWDMKESPRWVFQWYTRLGYDEKEFGHDNALMKLPIKENNEI